MVLGLTPSRTASSVVDRTASRRSTVTDCSVHVDRPGKPSLVLDLVEEFRSAVVDRPILGMVSRGTVVRMHGGLISPDDRGKVAAKVLDRLDDTDYYEGKQHKYRTIIQQQARRAASFFRGEGTYEAHIARW